MNIFMDRTFAEIDVVLRRGGNINRLNITYFNFVAQHFEEMQAFYGKYGCTLHQHTDGCFYINGKDSLLRTRVLPQSAVHLGIFLALKCRDSEITRSSGRINIDQLYRDIETSVPRETLRRAYAPRSTDSTIDEAITDEIERALKILARLGYIEITATALRPLEAINRFADVARYENDPADDEKLRLQMQRGIIFESENGYSGEEYDDGKD
jgi:chromosome condensin MukBEF MukE localization factor